MIFKEISKSIREQCFLNLFLKSENAYIKKTGFIAIKILPKRKKDVCLIANVLYFNGCRLRIYVDIMTKIVVNIGCYFPYHFWSIRSSSRREGDGIKVRGMW